MSPRLQKLLPFIASASFAFASCLQAQPTSEPSNDTPPTAEKADQMRKQSQGAHNPTEQNKTFPNQLKEQPPTSPPDKPQVMTHAQTKATDKSQSDQKFTPYPRR